VNASMAVAVSMFVYIAVASAVKILAFGGRCGRFWSSCRMWLELRR